MARNKYSKNKQVKHLLKQKQSAQEQPEVKEVSEDNKQADNKVIVFPDVKRSADAARNEEDFQLKDNFDSDNNKQDVKPEEQTAVETTITKKDSKDNNYQTTKSAPDNKFLIKQNEELDDDDSAVLKLENEALTKDEVLDEFENSGLIDQGADAITYSVNNLYKDKKMRKFRDKLDMRANPPVLKVESSSGDSARFFLTENLNKRLLTMLKDVQKGYLGIRKTHQHTDTIPSSHRGLGKIAAIIRLRFREVLLAAIFSATGLLFSQSFYWPSLIGLIIGLIYIFYPQKKKEDD